MTKCIFTCEHGGNLIPQEFTYLFKSKSNLLNSHRSYDIGIFDVFKYFSNEFKCQSYHTKTSRLLIEFNRSLHSNNLFSEITKSLDEKTKKKIITDYYLPYRNHVKDSIEQLIRDDQKVVHISFHSFTPELKGKVRNADIGFLYDPKFINEKKICRVWKNEILRINNKLRIRFNYPYLGIADGITSFLRKEFGYKNYSGIELEINQKLLDSVKSRLYITDILAKSFRHITKI